jgi:hypothetical protein
MLAVRSYSEDLDALTGDILLEARNPSGTWSLATHKRISDWVHERDIGTFLANILDRICNPEVEMEERFKLAQLCTMCHHKGFASSTDIFARYKDRLTVVMDESRPHPLGGAVCKLLGSLFAPPTRPAGSLNRPVVRPRGPAKCTTPSIRMTPLTMP